MDSKKIIENAVLGGRVGRPIDMTPFARTRLTKLDFGVKFKEIRVPKGAAFWVRREPLRLASRE